MIKNLKQNLKSGLKTLKIIFKCIFNIGGWEWFSPEVREFLRREEGLSMTPEEFKHEMELLIDLDVGARHVEMDDLICGLLTELGYGDGIDIFYNVTKWYE